MSDNSIKNTTDIHSEPLEKQTLNAPKPLRAKLGNSIRQSSLHVKLGMSLVTDSSVELSMPKDWVGVSPSFLT